MNRKLVTALAAVSALSLLAAGCGKKDDDGKNDKPTASPKVTTPKTPAPAAKMSLTDRNVQCFNAFSKKDWKTARGCLADDAVQTMVGMPMNVKGGDAMVAMAKQWSTAMEGNDVQEVVLISGNNVVNLMSFSGKNIGPMPMMGAMEATHKEVSGFGLQTETYNADQKITEMKAFWDMGLVMAQLGGNAPSNHKAWGLAATHIAKDDDAEKANLAAFDAAIAAIQKGDVKTFLGAFQADAEIYMNGMPTLKGPEGKGAFLTSFVTAFPDLKLTIDTRWAAGPYIFAEVGWTGTNKGAMKPLIPAATGKEVAMTNGELFLMEDGKIKKQWVVMNSASLLIQLGLVKPPAMPAADAKGDKKAAPAKGDDKAAPAKK